MSLLDKKRLYEACSEVGIEVPETRLLSARLGDREAGGIADELGYPVILKPRTQAYLSGGIKGFIVDDPREFAKQRSRFHRLVQFNAAIRARYPDLAEPMVQRYYSSAETDTLSVAGFVGCKSEFVARGAGKVLQRPRKVGIGLCFESRETEGPLLTGSGRGGGCALDVAVAVRRSRHERRLGTALRVQALLQHAHHEAKSAWRQAACANARRLPFSFTRWRESGW